MATIDLLNLAPTTISRDLKGKYILIYGQPKTGKTTFAAGFKKNLLCAFEIGYHQLSNVYAQPVQTWSDFKLILRQLETDAVKDKFDTITLDTVGIAYGLCEQFICSRNNVQSIADIPWGGGYAQVKNEFEQTLRKITMLGYGLILIAHSEERVEKKGDNETVYYSPALNKRCYEICNRLVDIIGYIGMEWDDNNNAHRFLITRQTPTVMAGSRYKYLAPKIEFGYSELVNAISEAIDMSEKIDGATVVEHTEELAEEKLDYKSLRAEALDLWTKLVGSPDNPDEDMAKRIMKRVEMIFGRPMKLSEITEDQVDLYNLVVFDMRDLLSETK